MRRQAERVYSIIEVARQGGRWGYSDINFSARRPDGPPEPGAGPGWRQVSPVPVAGSGLAAAGAADDRRRVYYQEQDRSLVGTAYEPSSPDGRWTGYRVLTRETGAPVAGAGAAVAVTGRIGALRVYYLDSGPGEEGRHPVRLAERGEEWTYSTCAGAPHGSPISPLAAVTTERGEFAYYLDAPGRLIEASWLGEAGWSVRDLTSGVDGCPAASPLSRLTAVGCGTDSRLVYFLDEDNRPVQLAHTVVPATKKRPEGDAEWRVLRLSAYGAPAAAAGSPPAVVLSPDGHPRLYYLDADRTVVEVGFNGRGWEVHRAGTEADDGAGAPAAAGGSSLAAVPDGDGSAVQVFYLGAAGPDGGPDGCDHHLIELRGSGRGWRSRDLGAELDLPTVATGVPSPFAAIRTSGPRVYYTSEE
ncbi:hypothetical protein ACFVUH_36320 [Kitasatospora sp. NPDC058032]|uniref:hypothetical protein n=1 Tax=Kitasatospora sp. NPDC058032 TaxID=3346307 RepID=UPI0036DC767B